jgi:shikimate kinase
VLAGRDALYRACADHRISTENRSLEEVAGVIEQLWTILPHHQLR